MSEMINNREFRQKVLKELIMELHNGKTVEEVKPRFEELIQGISTREISEMEQSLIMSGMPVEEIQKLCDVHAAVFKGSIEEIHRPEKQEDIPGHPVHTFRLENKKIENFIHEQLRPDLERYKDSKQNNALIALSADFERLWEIDKHYSRKENLLFPYMEKYGITAPPKVMWGVDDEIRDAIREVQALIKDKNATSEDIIDKADIVMNRITEMIFKEENILFPMVLETLSEDEWYRIAKAEEEIGYTFVEPRGIWKPVRLNIEKAEEQITGIQDNEAIYFDAGLLTQEEANAMLNTLPVDITFVDRNGLVKYFTQGKERIFARPKTIIGREVKNCHPPASVHIVEQIIEDFKTGNKDHEDFWIKMKDQYVLIRYYAVRNAKGDYLGTMEVTQDIKPIQELSGEKRLMSD